MNATQVHICILDARRVLHLATKGAGCKNTTKMTFVGVIVTPGSEIMTCAVLYRPSSSFMLSSLACAVAVEITAAPPLNVCAWPYSVCSFPTYEFLGARAVRERHCHHAYHSHSR